MLCTLYARAYFMRGLHIWPFSIYHMTYTIDELRNKNIFLQQLNYSCSRASNKKYAVEVWECMFFISFRDKKVQ